MKVVQVYTVRNEAGQFLATYRALTAEQAIAQLVRDQNTYASTFRRSGAPKLGNLTAKVEG